MYLIGLSRGLYEIIHIIRIVPGKCWLLSLSSFLNTGTLQISSDSSNNRVSILVPISLMRELRLRDTNTFPKVIL